ncbi:MAG: UDP-3-O-acyl-N-acetylglucosamine deacetylase, partial [Thermodesulfovibrionales bacterium]|nr:UDP-3-O-acyl-N-acetylglucosamine deacetylase [Thermodesulfovibrionales bacterium]
NNAIVIGDKGVINPSGLRFDDEFVRHKILDCIGDFSLIGCPIYGHFILERSGHSSNIKFISELLSTPQCYTYFSEHINYESFKEQINLTVMQA